MQDQRYKFEFDSLFNHLYFTHTHTHIYMYTLYNGSTRAKPECSIWRAILSFILYIYIYIYIYYIMLYIYIYIYIYISTESTCKLQNTSTHSLTTHVSLYYTSFICAIIFVFIYYKRIFLWMRFNCLNAKELIKSYKLWGD